MTSGQTGKRLSWRRFLEQQAGVDAEAVDAGDVVCRPVAGRVGERWRRGRAGVC